MSIESSKKTLYMSTTRIAKSQNIQASPYLFDYLIELGFLTKEFGKYQLTKSGVEMGGIYQSNNKGEQWVAWKENSLNKIINELKFLKKVSVEDQKPLIVDKVEIQEFNYDERYKVICFTKDEKDYYYELNQILTSEKFAMSLANKIRTKGIINPILWDKIEIFNYHISKESSTYDDNEYDMTDVYDDFATEDGEPTYLSDGVWLYPDGSMKDDKKGR